MREVRPMRPMGPLCGAALLALSLGLAAPQQAVAAAPLQQTPVTIACQDVTLARCLKAIHDQYKVEIHYPKSEAGKLLAVSFDNRPLDRLLNDLADQVGLANYVVSYEEEARAVYLRQIGSGEDLASTAVDAPAPPAATAEGTDGRPGQTAALQPPADAQPSSLRDDDEVLPPDAPGKRGMTLGELRAWEARAVVAPGDMEVIPPSEPGQPGVTRSQFLAAEEQNRPAVDPRDMEVIPPAEPGAKGKTLRQVQLEEARSQLDRPAVESMEVIPPDTPGGQGLTLEQFQARERQEGTSGPVLPPDSPAI